jgi:hypothetical protein
MKIFCPTIIQLVFAKVWIAGTNTGPAAPGNVMSAVVVVKELTPSVPAAPAIPCTPGTLTISRVAPQELQQELGADIEKSFVAF